MPRDIIIFMEKTMTIKYYVSDPKNYWKKV